MSVLVKRGKKILIMHCIVFFAVYMNKSPLESLDVIGARPAREGKPIPLPHELTQTLSSEFPPLIEDVTFSRGLWMLRPTDLSRFRGDLGPNAEAFMSWRPFKNVWIPIGD